jgi:hypothetical protein
MADEQLPLRKPALTLLIGAALEHFFLVSGDLGIGHVCRYGLFFLGGGARSESCLACAWVRSASRVSRLGRVSRVESVMGYS